MTPLAHPAERSPARRVTAARRAIRAGAELLEAGRPARGVALLGEAAELLVEIHASLDGLPPSARDGLTRAFREVCHLLADAALLRDAGAARGADLACVPLAAALSPGHPGGGESHPAQREESP